MTDYERFGDYQPVERGTAGVALAFLFIGIGVGTVAALLLAPKTGKQIRRALRRKYEDARDVIEDWTEHAGDAFEKGTNWTTSMKEKVAPFASAAAKKARGVAE